MPIISVSCILPDGSTLTCSATGWSQATALARCFRDMRGDVTFTL